MPAKCLFESDPIPILGYGQKSNHYIDGSGATFRRRQVNTDSGIEYYSCWKYKSGCKARFKVQLVMDLTLNWMVLGKLTVIEKRHCHNPELKDTIYGCEHNPDNNKIPITKSTDKRVIELESELKQICMDIICSPFVKFLSEIQTEIQPQNKEVSEVKATPLQDISNTE